MRCFLKTLGILLVCAAASGCVTRPMPAFVDNSHRGVHSGHAAVHGGKIKTGNPYRIAGRTYYPLATAHGYDQIGIASWYGRDFHGRRTANGERYDMHALTAAHKTLPLPTLVRVTNLENGRSVVVRVNDRGPFVKNRLIDLSYAAARRLGFTDKGTARVRVQTLDMSRPGSPPEVLTRTPKSLPAATAQHTLSQGNLFIQLGAFSSAANAHRIRDRLRVDFTDVLIQPMRLGNGILYRVRIGPLDDIQQIEQTIGMLQARGFGDAIVVIE